MRYRILPPLSRLLTLVADLIQVMTSPELPAEILTYIFELVVHDEALFTHSIPTCMSESHWERRDFGEKWQLVSPVEAIYSRQTKKYAITKVKVLCFHHPLAGL